MTGLVLDLRLLSNVAVQYKWNARKLFQFESVIFFTHYVYHSLLLCLGLKSLQLPEQPTMSVASSLMVTIINLIPSSEIVRKLILMRGVELVEFLLKGVAGGVDRSRLDFLVNIFHALLFQCITELSSWLQVSLLLCMSYDAKFSNSYL